MPDALTQGTTWAPTRRQWFCWIIAHSCCLLWATLGFAIEELYSGASTAHEISSHRALQQLNLASWCALAVALSIGPILSDHRLGGFWRLVGCVGIIFTMGCAFFVSIMVMGIVAISTNGLEGTQ